MNNTITLACYIYNKKTGGFTVARLGSHTLIVLNSIK